MIDIHLIRQNPEVVSRSMIARGLQVNLEEILSLDDKRRALTFQVEEISSQRNRLAAEVPALKARGATQEEISPIIQKADALKASSATLEAQLAEVKQSLSAILSSLPNVLDDDVPIGETEAQNVEITRWGEPPKFSFQPKQHFELNLIANLFGFEVAGGISGSRFSCLQGPLARLSRALSSFMLEQNTKAGYMEVEVPLLVSSKSCFGTGQLPKFEEDLFKVNGKEMYLIPTSEVPLTNIVANSTVPEAELPLRYTALSPCFRSEAGSAGRDTRGLLRQHQFYKVELVTISTPEQSSNQQELMLNASCSILQQLNIPYRVVSLCSGDIGFSAAKTYDIEVWLPGQGTYREIASISNTRCFQARRMNSRYKPDAKGKKSAYTHTLNGSSVAVGRCLIAICENFQTQDGNVLLPEAIARIMGQSYLVQ